jgi:hypothetical protein
MLVMEDSPPAPSVAIWECAGDGQDIDFCKSTCTRIVKQRLDRCYGAARVAPIGVPKDANKMYKVQTGFPRARYNLLLLQRNDPGHLQNSTSTLGASQRCISSHYIAACSLLYKVFL